MGKTSKRRPCLISRGKETLRWDLAFGKITAKEFNDAIRKLKDDKPNS